MNQPTALSKSRGRRSVLQRHWPAMVEWVFNERFATARQIQMHFAAYLPSDRTAQRQLAQLVKLRYLARVPVRDADFRAPVYVCTRRGITLIKQAYAEVGHTWRQPASVEEHRQRGVSSLFMSHELLITDLDLLLRLSIDHRNDAELLWQERRFHRRDRRLHFTQQGKHFVLQPDAAYLIKVADRFLLFLAEIDRGTATLPVTKHKLQRYHYWLKSEEAQLWLDKLALRHNLPFPPKLRLLILTQGSRDVSGDDQRLRNVYRLSIDFPRNLRKLTWLTTADHFSRQLNQAGPHDEPIWLRANDANKWLSNYRHLKHHLPLAPEHQRYNRRRLDTFVAGQLSKQRKHKLLPDQHLFPPPKAFHAFARQPNEYFSPAEVPAHQMPVAYRVPAVNNVWE